MALWNPLAYHTSNDLINNVGNIDGYISCYSKLVDSFFTLKFNKPIIGYINHTLSEPILELSVNIHKCFYIGLNWEKLSTLTPERTKILNILKNLEKYNLISIYGPTQIGGVELWKGYSSYSGEIPFNGVSVIYEIKKCGVCLVFSSDNHINSGIASNRLFEGLAAGVPLICDKNPFIQEWFGDNVFYIDTTDLNCVGQIINHINYMRENPSIVLEKMEKCRKIFIDNFLLDKQISSLLLNIMNNYSQLGQDVEVLKFYNHKENGFYIEIGASDGITLSNTYLLATKYNWKGICVEPIPKNFELLCKNRPYAACCNNAVYNESNKEVIFDIANNDDLLSGINSHIDCHKNSVDNNKTQIIVTTITLNDLLEKYNAPLFIDYMSLDTEGSELEILKSVDLTKYIFGLIDVEHNFIEPRRSQIRELLESNGYIFIKENQWDDCYKHSSI